LPVFAGIADSPDYYTVGAEAITVTETGADKEVSLEKPGQLPGPSKQLAIALGIINAGAAAWNVISDGAPSFEAASSYASALPPGLAQNWSTVAKWTGPKEYLYSYKVTNLMGIEVVNVQYKISFYYGGKEIGKTGQAGSYIANFTVRPVKVNIKWGWHFNMQVGMSDPMNIGTVREPVAFIQADLKWRLSTLLSKDGEVGIWSYVVDGKGNFRDLTAEVKALTKQIPSPLTPGQVPLVSWN